MAAPLRSMTGFAQARAEQNGWALRVNLRSVNHRFLDIHLRLPDGFEPFEIRIRQALRDRLRRGHVDLTLYFEPAGPAAVHINRAVAAAYLQAARDLREEFSLDADPDLAAILRLPGVIDSAAPSEEEQEQIANTLLGCVQEAAGKLNEMRESEGRALSQEMKGRLEHIAQNAAKIETLAASVRMAYAQRLESRLKELLADSSVDPQRILQEAAIVAERGDIAEEVTRMRSHVQQFQSLLASGGEIGKKLDFLLQEMQREANTTLSKTPGIEADGLAITNLALEVKSEIEKLREQAQNIE
ncbi:MAG: YicC family protein [Acidobacteria bacterium]|nr:YicC family protein [Acidobacteriota bacterium]